jgi:hypothetical protein
MSDVFIVVGASGAALSRSLRTTGSLLGSA